MTSAHHGPNLILLISHDLGCHIGPCGWAADRTPRLNELAAAGVRFDRHFVTSPGCSQSRSSLVTGRYPHANGQFGLAHLGWTLHRDEVLLPAVLRESGYHTALVGIWHLHEWTLAGFDTISADVSTRDESPEGYAEVAGPRAADWLRTHGPQTAPFYLHVGFWETHRPFCGTAQGAESAHADAADVRVPPYLPDNEATRGEFSELHRSVSLVDAGVGQILAALDDAGLRDETLVLFTADHGLPFPRAKGTLYDPGLHVALVARWPGRIPPGAVVGDLTSNVDVMPTLLAAAGAAIPERVQGRSFFDLLTPGGGTPQRGGRAPARDAVFAEKTYHEHYDPMRAVRTERHKYIRSFAERPRLVMPSDVYNSPTRRSMTADETFWSHRPPEELYDLQADAGEQANLADQPQAQATLAELRSRLAEWMQATGDPLVHGPIPRGRSGFPA